jgi:hemoglobin
MEEAGVTVFAALGGEAGIRALVDRFYELMDGRSDAATIRALHPASLEGSRDKLFWFLCGWSGGPDHYISRFGHPRLRARHLPFSIGEPERDQWLACMGQALTEQVGDDALRQRLFDSFTQTADWMRNRAG